MIFLLPNFQAGLLLLLSPHGGYVLLGIVRQHDPSFLELFFFWAFFSQQRSSTQWLSGDSTISTAKGTDSFPDKLVSHLLWYSLSHFLGHFGLRSWLH